jgi:hypothetical protein
LATNAGASRRAAWQRAGGWLARRREVAPAVRRRASLPQCKTCCSALAADWRNVAAARCAAFMAAGGHAARHASASRPPAAVCREQSSDTQAPSAAAEQAPTGRDARHAQQRSQLPPLRARSAERERERERGGGGQLCRPGSRLCP